MKNKTRELFTAYQEGVADINSVSSDVVIGGKGFTVDPTIEQSLEDVMREEAGFLNRISFQTVDEQQGETIGLDISSPIASNTDTKTKDRQATDVSELSPKNSYHCQQTNSDTAIRYAKLDMWAKYPDFQERISRAIARQRARDTLMVGWNGTSRAADSDKAANPLLQDVGKGWFQKMRDKAPARVLKDGATAGQIKVGKGGDYNHIDALVLDMVNNLIDPWHQEDSDLIVIVGRQLFDEKYFNLVNSFNEPTERLALDVIMSNKQVGNMPAARVPFLPPRAIAITTLENLAIYRQEGTTRRTIVDNAKRDRIEDYNSINTDYIIEDYGLMCMAESDSIKLKKADGSWA